MHDTILVFKIVYHFGRRQLSEYFSKLCKALGSMREILKKSRFCRRSKVARARDSLDLLLDRECTPVKGTPASASRATSIPSGLITNSPNDERMSSEKMLYHMVTASCQHLKFAWMAFDSEIDESKSTSVSKIKFLTEELEDALGLYFAVFSESGRRMDYLMGKEMKELLYSKERLKAVLESRTVTFEALVKRARKLKRKSYCTSAVRRQGVEAMAIIEDFERWKILYGVCSLNELQQKQLDEAAELCRERVRESVNARKGCL